ncbi:MAG: acyl--CoA ligase [Actinobacteria bacterium]|nr:acyl--CoA ligase [Actinomycetota bacterium]
MTVASTVVEAARRFGDRPALVASAGWSLSYAQLDALSDDVAAVLAADHGIGEGDLVALVLPSSPDYVVAYAAIAKLGAIAAGVNPRATAHERDGVLAAAEPALVVAADVLVADRAVAHPHVVVSMAAEPDEVLAGLRRGDAPPAPVLTDPDAPDRLVTVVFTSGTTGLPKGAMFANAELAAVTRADLGPRAGDWGGGGPMLSGTECAHVGLMTKLPTYLRTGATVFVLDRWRAADVLRLVHEHRMAVVGGVAPQVALLLRRPELDEYDLSCVQAIVMGGSASSPALVREARERFGAPYSIRYSSTESGGIGLGTAFDADDDEAFHSVGRPRGDTEVTVRDGDGRPVPEGEVGELWLRSSTMFRGYWRNPEATAEAVVDGWLRTGDLARIGADGLVRLAGRAKEMYIRGGYNVYPVEVEGVLATHPAVADVVVVPRPDAVMGEIGVAVVVPAHPGAPPTLADLRAHAAERLAPYKLPEALRIVDEIPLTGMHKQDRRALAVHEARSSEP